MNLLDLPLEVVELILSPPYTAPLESAVLSHVCKLFAVITRTYVLKKREVCESAAADGHLEVLKWAILNKYPLDEETNAQAAKNGHLEVLKFAREHGCPCDEITCSVAAQNGQLEILKYAHDQGCPWDEYKVRGLHTLVI